MRTKIQHLFCSYSEIICKDLDPFVQFCSMHKRQSRLCIKIQLVFLVQHNVVIYALLLCLPF